MRLTVVAAALLAATAASATPPPRQLLLDAPVALSAAPAASGVGTEVLVWPGLRVGAFVPVGGPLVLGGDVGFAGTGAIGGTTQVSASRAVLGIDTRGLVGLSLGGRFTRVTPYLFGGLLAVGGPSVVRGGASERTRFVSYGGARGGGGVLFTLGWASLRVELGGGVVDSRPDLTSSVALGLALPSTDAPVRRRGTTPPL